jgi:hypothetical protein
MKKKYTHNVIRLRLGKKIREHTIWIIAILNKRKAKSLQFVYKIGYIRFGYNGIFCINFKKLAFFLNKGFIIKKSVKNLLRLII